MSPRRLPAPMRVFRIGDPAEKYPIYSGEGAASVEGRWHERGQEVIYTSEHYSTAMLEKLAHYNGLLPPNQHFMEIELPAGTSYEEVTKDSLPESRLPDWQRPDGAAARRFGAEWIRARRSAILIVPSTVAREESNVLVNPRHADAKAIRPGREKPVFWDTRLFSQGSD